MMVTVALILFCLVIAETKTIQSREESDGQEKGCMSNVQHCFEGAQGSKMGTEDVWKELFECVNQEVSNCANAGGQGGSK